MRRILFPAAVLCGLMISACGDDTGSGGAGGTGGEDTTKSTTTGPTTTGPTTTSTTTTTTDTTNSSTTSSMAMCGDGTLDAGEDCDDGNTDAADGCADDCTVEDGWECDGASPTVCTPTCGDGSVLGSEACDDGNTDAADGCAADCTVEMGWSCDDGMPSVCTPNCGDGAIDGMETCDDGNNDDGDGCSAACAEENGFTCTGEPSVCASTCGDGLVASDEACDDGNTDVDDGCSDVCNVESGYDCSGEPSVCALFGSCIAPIVVTGNGFTFQAPGGLDPYGDDLDMEDASCATDNSDPSGKPDVVFSVALLAGETLHVAESGAADVLMHVVTGACSSASTCAASFDGIGATEINPGLAYTAPADQTVLVVVDTWSPSSAASAVDLLFEINPCGDGNVALGEGCDDGNTADGDGCSALCAPEAGYTCTGEPSTCVLATCADPILVTGTSFTFAGTNINQYGDNENYNMGTSCADVGAPPSGFDLVFSANLTAGQTIRLRELGGLDSVLHIFAGGLCGANTACAASVDGSSTAETAGISFTATTAGPVFLAVESFTNPSATTTFDIRIDISECGNGTVEFGEVCDDGNTATGDGCNATCAVETGFLCEGTPSSCFSIVGCSTAQCYLGPCAGGTIVTGTAAGLPAPIPDGASGGGVLGNISATIPLVGSGTVRKLVTLHSINHAFDSDVDIYLTGPDAVQRDVCTDNGGSGVNFVNTALRDGAPTAITSGTAPFTGVFRPETAYSAYTGQPVAGNWTMRVEDDFAADTGTFNKFEIAVCVDP